MSEKWPEQKTLPEKEKPFKLPGPIVEFCENVPQTDIEATKREKRREEVRKAEKREIKEADFGVVIDKDQVLKIDVQEVLGGAYFGNEQQRTDKIQELERIKETIMRLPEQLRFDPGITLIVGENGSGKTTIAKALHYISQIEWGAAYNRELEDREDSIRFILDPPPNSGAILEIKNSGLAPHIARAISASSYAAVEYYQKNMYWDFAKEAGRLNQLQDEIVRDAWLGRMRGERDAGSIRENRESNRQSIDRLMVERIRPREKHGKGPQIDFFDEPEVGMDPMRHMRILDELESFSPENSIAIVPTNSPVLFANPEIPRIDLRYPERGIFKPKDYPEEKE